MRSILLFFVIQTFLISSIFSQPEIDSLIQVGKDLEGIEKVNNLINISRQYFINDDSLAIPYAEQAIDVSTQINYPQGFGKAMLFQALAYEYYDRNKAIEYFLTSSDTLASHNDPWTGFGYENAARIYNTIGMYPEAISASLKALDAYEKAGDSVQYAKTASIVGFNADLTGNHREGIHWQKIALSWLPPGQAPDIRGLIIGRMGIAYDEMKIWDSAHIFNSRAIEIFREIEDYYYLGQWLSNKANTYMKQGRFDKAEKLLNEALLYAGDSNETTILSINLSKVYMETGRYQKAMEALDTAILRANRLGQPEFLSEAYFRKYELNQKLGQTKNALKNYKLYSDLQDSLLNEKKTEQLANMKVRYETEQKEKLLLQERAEKERLEKEKALAEIRVYNRNRWIIVIAGLSLIIILAALAYGQRKRRKIQADKDAAIIEEREKGIKAVFDAQEEERQRIAKDLHDGVGQQISAVKIHLQGFKKETAAKFPDGNREIDNIVEMISETGNDVRNISHQMMPRALTELGLVAALEDMLEKSFKYHNIDYSFENHGLENRLPDHVEIGLYRIAQELINNILKHAGASKVDIQLMKTKSYCLLIVQDNGKGLVEKEKSDGIGMMNINNRLRTLKGVLNMESDTGTGTTATIRIALTS